MPPPTVASRHSTYAPSTAPTPPDTAVAVVCPSCAAPIAERYCARCGEKRPMPDDLSIGHVARELWDHVASFDGRLVRTLLLLVRRPGLLAAEFARGARSAYTRPVQLYLLTSVVFFLVAPRLGLFDYRIPQPLPPTLLQARGGWQIELIARKAREIGSLELLRDRFNASVGTHMGLVFLLVVPVLALLVAVLHPRQRRFAAEHLVFAVHLTTFVILAELAAGTVGWLLGRIPALSGPQTFYGVLLVAFALAWAHTTRAMRRFYGDATVGAVARALVVAGAFALFPRVFWLVVTTLTWLLL